jgi:transposase-like protein
MEQYIEHCPNCGANEYCKDGIVKNKQRYKCKSCNFRFTVEAIGKPKVVKRNALILYLEGLELRTIGAFLNVSHVAVHNWMKSYGEPIEELRSPSSIEMVELNKLRTYIDAKGDTIDYGMMLVNMGTDSEMLYWRKKMKVKNQKSTEFKVRKVKF